MVLRPMTPVLAISDVMIFGPCSTFDVINFDQNWQLYINLLSFAGGKDLSIDNQIRVVGSIEPDAKTFLMVSIRMAECTACKQIRNGKTSRSKLIG